jgi:hypothetical protein
MIASWLDLPSAGLFAALAALYAATGAAIFLVTVSRVSAKAVLRADGVVAPFFASVSILFALLTGFLASDIADRNRQATRAVQSEAGALRNVHTLSIASVSDMRDIREAIADYVKTVVGDEWSAMAENRRAPSAGNAYDALLRHVSDPKITKEASAAVHVALLNATVRVGSARSERLAIASDRTNDIKWLLVLILGAMTQVSIAIVHLKNRGAQVAALAVFSIAVVIALGMIALQERPFAGEIRVQPGPLLELAKLPTS